MFTSDDKLVLHNLNSYYSKTLDLLIIFVIFLMLAAFVFFLFDEPYEVLNWSIKDWLQWLSDAWEKINNDPTKIWPILSLLFPFLHMVYMYQAHHRERFILTSSGIHYQSPMPGFLQWLKPDWSINWSMISGAYFKPAKLGRGPTSVFLVIETSVFSKKMTPCIWFDPNNSEHPPSLLQLQWQSFSPQQTKHTLPHCPVTKYFTRMGIEVKTDKIDNLLSEQPLAFALESNRHSLTAMILFLTLFIYALLDLTLNPEAYVDKPFYQIYFWGGVFASLLVMGWLIWAKVPKSESIGIALFFGIAFGAALYPGLLRINQLTDTQGLQTYQYVLQSDYSLKSLDDEKLPRLYFLSDFDYWSHFEPESLHDIELRKGGLGFYQINMAPIYDDMREYFDEK
jgi:hypothetical protein